MLDTRRNVICTSAHIGRSRAVQGRAALSADGSLQRRRALRSSVTVALAPLAMARTLETGG